MPAQRRLRSGLRRGDPELRGPAGTTLDLVDADGKIVATFATAEVNRSVVFSAAAITDGDTYTLQAAGGRGRR